MHEWKGCWLKQELLMNLPFIYSICHTFWHAEISKLANKTLNVLRLKMIIYNVLADLKSVAHQKWLPIRHRGLRSSQTGLDIGYKRHLICVQ